MKVLLFLGAGASVELGIPAMRAMAQEFHSHLASQKLSQTVLARFEALLSDADYDIEHLIETIDGIVDGATQRTKLGLCVADDLETVAPIMSREAEWYIQHVCEQLREVDARVLWSAALRKAAGHELCLATTNYDRSIEIGCRFNDVVIDDGFELFGEGREIARWKGVDSGSPLQLLKMHGSTDWYQGDDEHIFKLSHPMPLYGNLAVVDNENQWPKMTSALVLPTREKRSESSTVSRSRHEPQERSQWSRGCYISGHLASRPRHRRHMQTMCRSYSYIFCVQGWRTRRWRRKPGGQGRCANGEQVYRLHASQVFDHVPCHDPGRDRACGW